MKRLGSELGLSINLNQLGDYHLSTNGLQSPSLSRDRKIGTVSHSYGGSLYAGISYSICLGGLHAGLFGRGHGFESH